jgi:oligosaccharide translocation protein RFT1
VGAFIESAGEPWNNSNLVNMTIRPRIIGEFIGLFVKSVLTYLFLVYYNYGIYSFGIGQVGYSIALLATIIVSTSGSLLDYFPRYVVGFSFFNLKTAQLAMSNTAVVLLKHVLTEADKITLSMLATAEDQGVYAITSNYGSLIARLIFLPIEDSTKLAVAKLAAIIRAESKNGDEEMAAIAVLITTLLRMSLLIFILLPVVGPHYVELLVTLVFTSNSKLNHSTFIATLSAYCVYLYTLALNGVSEAYVHAIAPAHVLGGRINYGLLLSSVAYFIVVISIKGATTCVIIYAGAGAMAVRALSNITYIRQTLHIDTCHAALDLPTSTITRIPQATILPFNFVITLLLLGVFVLTYLSADYYHVNHTQSLKYAVQHLLLGVVCVLSYLYCTYRYHRTDYLYIYDLLVRRKAKRD